jgi:hypothetical protein
VVAEGGGARIRGWRAAPPSPGSQDGPPPRSPGIGFMIVPSGCRTMTCTLGIPSHLSLVCRLDKYSIVYFSFVLRASPVLPLHHSRSSPTPLSTSYRTPPVHRHLALPLARDLHPPHHSRPSLPPPRAPPFPPPSPRRVPSTLSLHLHFSPDHDHRLREHEGEGGRMDLPSSTCTPEDRTQAVCHLDGCIWCRNRRRGDERCLPCVGDVVSPFPHHRIMTVN